MVVIFCSFTPFLPPETLLPVIPLGLINGIFILITNRATKAHRRRQENYRTFDGSCRGSKEERHFYHFVMKPWLYSRGALDIHALPCSTYNHAVSQ